MSIIKKIMIIQIILKNIIKSFKKHEIKIDEKLLMWDNFSFEANIYFKNKKEKDGSFSIPCIFLEYKNNETIKVIISDNFKEKLNNENIILGNIECFIIVPEFVYNFYNNKHMKLNDINNLDKDIDLFDYMEYKKDEKNNNLSSHLGSSNIDDNDDNKELNNLDQKENLISDSKLNINKKNKKKKKKK